MLILRKHCLLFMALEALAINYYLFFNNWISWIFIGLLLFRIIQVGKPWILIGGIVFGFVWEFYQNNKILKLTRDMPEHHVSSHFYHVYADQIKINGNLISFEAKDYDNHQRVKCTYYCKKKDDIQSFRELSGKLTINVNADVKIPNLPTNENQFNYQNFLYSRNINQIVKIKDLIQINREDAYFLENFSHQIREMSIRWLNNLPSPLKGYANSLILGISSDDFKNTIKNIHKLGLNYLFCLSGMHVFFICRYLSFACSFLFIPIEFSNILLLFGLPVYLVIGGNSLSLSRAIWMVWLGIFSSFIFKRKLSGIECWSIVLIVNLINQPLTFLSLGSVLSYLMTFIILLSERKDLISFKLNNYSIPLVLNFTYQYNFLTTVLSIIYGVIFEKIIFPITIIGTFFPVLSLYCNQIIKMNDWVLDRLSYIPTTVTFGKLPFISVVGIISIMFLIENHQKKILKLLLIGMIYFISWMYIFFPIKTTVVYFDIGQGDSILVQKAFSHRVFLIDTGGKLNFGGCDDKLQPTMGQKVIANYLLSKGITTISELYLTHQDTDHIGYMTSIGKQINYDKIIVPAGMERLNSFQKKLQNLKERQQKIKIIPVTNQSTGTFFQILHPFKSGKGKNEDSLVLYYQIQGFRFLFTGDLDQAGELKLIKKYPNLKTDILKAGHHGSKTSSNPEFVRKINPKMVIISVGRNNRYGHPNYQTIKTFESQKIPYLTTAENGMIKIKVDNSKIKIDRWLKEDVNEPSKIN